MTSKLSQLVAVSGMGAMAFFLVSCSQEKPHVKLTKPISTEVEKDPTPDEVPVIKEPEKEVEVVEADPEEIKEKEPSKMQALLQGKTVYIEDDHATRRDCKKDVEHYVVYFTADWSGKCKKNIPLVKQFYNEYVKDNPKVELVMASMDDPKWLIKWAVAERFEWPLLLRDDLREIDFMAPLGQKYAYYFVMHDAEGESLGTVTLENCVEILQKSEDTASSGEDAK